MIIKLSTRTSYDLSKADRRGCLVKKVALLAKKGDITELQNIQSQFQKIPELSVEAEEISVLVDGHLPPPQETNQPIAAFEIKPGKGNQWQKTGEDNFRKCYAAFIKDFSTYSGNLTFLKTWSAIVLNLYVHMATSKPQDNNSLAQEREWATAYCLEYLRSQGKHTNGQLYKKAMRILGGNDTGESRLPLRAPFVKMIDGYFPDVFNTLKKFDYATGLPKKAGTVSGYASLNIAHAGARVNNLAMLEDIITQGLSKYDKKAFLAFLAKLLPPAKVKDKKLPKAVLLNRAKAYRQAIEKRAIEKKSLETADGSVLQFRLKRVEKLRQAIIAKKYQQIDVKSTQSGTSCLFLRIFPQSNRKDAAFSEGVTNVMVSVFGAILNHHLQKNNIKLYTARRQSFGFLRPTLTDAGNLVIRLSLGLEPSAFDAVLMQSLDDFAAILNDFNFDEASKKTVKDLLKKKNPDPNKKRQRTFIHSAVASDRLTQKSYEQALYYINTAYQANPKGKYIQRGIQSYLRKYILEEKAIEVKQLTAVEVIPVSGGTEPIANILQNTLAQIVTYVKEAPIDFEQPASQELAASLYHSLKKLYKNIDEAETFLQSHENYESTVFFQRASLYLDHLLEYWIVLDALIDAQKKVLAADDQVQLAASENPAIQALVSAEKKEVAQIFNLSSDIKPEVFFTDSGQQAIISSIIFLASFHHQAAEGEKYNDNEVHLFGNAYFEVPEFLKDCKKENKDFTVKHVKDLSKAKVVFADVTELQLLSLDKCSAMKALVIDITHNPEKSDNRLKATVQQCMEKGIQVILVNSSLKHEQLGMDKYQSGKLTALIPPSAKQLDQTHRSMLQDISDAAMHPLIASWLLMIKNISQKPMEEKKEAAEEAGVEQATPGSHGFFAKRGKLKKNAHEAASQENASLRV